MAASTAPLPRRFPVSPRVGAWLAFLALTLVIGLTAAILVFARGLTLTNLTNGVPWGLWITIDLSAIALGAGAFTLSAVAVGPAVTMAVAHIIEWITRKATVPHDVLRLIARTSGLGLLLYAYIKFWDLAAVSYYGRTPGSDQALYILRSFTPYGFGFWVGEILIGIVIPVLLFLMPRFNKRPAYLVLGAALAMVGVIFNRWNVTVSGLVVPLDYAPGVGPALVLPQPYLPNLTEWAIVLGVVGYALTLLTLGVRFLPLFTRTEEHKS